MVRKMVLTAAMMLLALPTLASAQADEVRVTASVANVADLSGSGDLDFGTLDAVNGNTINAAGGAGSAQRTLDYNHDVTVTFTNVPAVLVSGSNTLAVSLMCAAVIGAGSWTVPAACGSASIDLDVGPGFTQATLGFGGSILAAAIANAIAGDYEATFDIVVTAR